MSARSVKAVDARPGSIRLYVVTGAVVSHTPNPDDGMPTSKPLETGSILPADFPADRIQHLLDVGLIAAHDVPVSN